MSEDNWTHTVTGGSWPERIGLRCRIVPRPDGITTYPWTERRTRKGETVVLIEDDPFRKEHETAQWYADAYGAEWSCTMFADDITPIGQGDR